MGARPIDRGGVQFSIAARHAARVWLLLFDHPRSPAPSREIELDPAVHRIGDVWHIFVADARPGQGYAYRMEGEADNPRATHMNPAQWLLDPYAKAVAGHPAWGVPGALRAGHAATHGAAMPRAVVCDDAYDWTGDRTLRIPLEETILYEAHLRGYTAHKSAGTTHPGTYRGFMERIPHLQDLGITAVELLPVFEFNEMEYFIADDNRRHLRNYWGYSTIAFFAPNGRYAADGTTGEQVREFKDLVKALHQAGIEIILDVVFNHTGEGGRHGPTYSFRGIDNDLYYMMEDDNIRYRNYSGCGNTVNCNHPVVRTFILDCLRYWVQEMHVDGFRFDLATILTRGTDGEILANPPLVEAIAEDPVLRHAKLIAEAWDAWGAYQVGSFPNHRWLEWNGKYRDDARRFWIGDEGMLGAFARRLAGSADLYDRPKQGPLKSVNFITCHDGFTLHDLTSYREKHNHANGEENRDGERHNHSDNFGIEGPTDDPTTRRQRRRRIKNYLATLMLSQGVPMLLAGDEFANSQEGNNNAYCQDGPLSWLDWGCLDKEAELHAFVKQAIAFRKAHPSLRRTRFFRGKADNERPPDIEWFGPHGRAPHWHHGRSVSCLIHPGPTSSTAALFLIVNGGKRLIDFSVPPAPGKPWTVGLTTEDAPPDWVREQETIRVEAQAITVLESGPF